MTKSKVYSYLRFSDAKQASGSSIDRQIEYAKRWADSRGMELDASLTLRDEGLSAYHQRHVKSGALGVFLAAVDEGKIAAGSILIVEGLDRLSRAEPLQAQAQLTQIINAGITVVTASDGREYNREGMKAQPMDLVYSLLVMIRAHEESDTKSKRVKASIRKLCQKWIDGTYRGVIRNGKDPAWVIWTGERFELIEERAAAIRGLIRSWQAGHGFLASMRKLKQSGNDLSAMPSRQVTLYRTLRNPMLIGTKRIEVDGQAFALENYYPPLIDADTWDEIQLAVARRTRTKGKAVFPGIITGIGIAFCGYCGTAMAAQNIHNRPLKLDGTPQDGHRRIHCSAGVHCDVGSSCSAMPIERALLTYCSDQFNLERLMRHDDSSDAEAEAHAGLAAVRRKIANREMQLEKLVNVLLEDEAAAPAIFARKARLIEDELASLRQDESAAATRVATTVVRSPSQAKAWKDLAKSALAMEEESRLKVRQLVIDTFERIVIYNAGVTPGDTRTSPIDMMLLAKGGQPRMLKINRRTGDLLNQEDIA